MYTITRQHRWDDGLNIVEITSGGIDYANPDALVKKYDGEFEEYNDPRETVEKAIEIAQSWQENTKDPVFIAMGNTGGATMHFDELELNEENFTKLRICAGKLYEKLRKCDGCGELLEKKYYIIPDYDDFKFCRQYCAEEFARENND